MWLRTKYFKMKFAIKNIYFKMKLAIINRMWLEMILCPDFKTW